MPCPLRRDCTSRQVIPQSPPPKDVKRAWLSQRRARRCTRRSKMRRGLDAAPAGATTVPWHRVRRTGARHACPRRDVAHSSDPTLLLRLTPSTPGGLAGDCQPRGDLICRGDARASHLGRCLQPPRTQSGCTGAARRWLPVLNPGPRPPGRHWTRRGLPVTLHCRRGLSDRARDRAIVGLTVDAGPATPARPHRTCPCGGGGGAIQP